MIYPRILELVYIECDNCGSEIEAVLDPETGWVEGYCEYCNTDIEYEMIDSCYEDDVDPADYDAEFFEDWIWATNLLDKEFN